MQYLVGRLVESAPKSSGRPPQMALPSLVAVVLQDHLARYSEPGADGLVFPAPEGGYLRLENFRKRAWNPP